MALLWNYAIFTKNPISLSWGDSVSGIQGLRYNFNQAWVSRLRFYGDNDVAWVTDRCGLPANYSAPYSWVLPPKSGGVWSNVWVRGTWAFTGSGALGRNIDATMEGSGTISNANLWLILSAVATLSGIWGLSADVSGALQASATLAGSGDLTASLGALAWAVATLSGSGTMDNDITALAFMSADIYVNQSEASVQQIVDGVWNALAASYNTSGTMWEAAQTGGGGGGATAAQIWAYSSRTLTESAWLSTEEHDKLFSLENSTWGGGGFSSQAIQSSINNAKREIIEKIEEIPQVSLQNVEDTLNEIVSQNDIYKNEIIDTIKSSENEVCSDIVRKSKELKEDNVTTRNLVRQKSDKVVKYAEKQLDRQEKTDKMIEDEANEIEKVLEQNIDFEADEIERGINTQIDQEIEEIESNLPNNGNNNGTEG